MGKTVESAKKYPNPVSSRVHMWLMIVQTPIIHSIF